MNRRTFLKNFSWAAGYSLVIDATGFAIGKGESASKEWLGEASTYNLQEAHMKRVPLKTDVFIAGGGMAGVCAALSAARNGSSVVLVQDRSRLGGNASSEIKMHIVGADQHGSRAGWRESGLIEELRIEDAVHNPHRAWELFDLMLYDKVISEPNITLLLDTVLFKADVENNKIKSVKARCDKTEHIFEIYADIFCDCTGDSRLALEAGAEFKRGREGKDEFNESLANVKGDMASQGSSILFTARKHDTPMPYTPPKWARNITKEHLKHRPVSNGAYEYGYWWIELGGDGDTIADNEQLRFELLAVVLGAWDYIKNSGNHKDSENWALQTVGMIPGKRESRRILGDHIQTQAELQGGWKQRDDGVSIGGWAFDEHPPAGFNDSDTPPFRSISIKEPYNIAFESLYSRNISNLMMAGRNISNSHVAFTSTRVMATCACTGQATGTAASIASQKNISPKTLRKSHIKELQQLLIKNDQTIRGIVNQDQKDLAKNAKVTASKTTILDAQAENILNGEIRHLRGEKVNAWMGDMESNGAWIQLEWNDETDINEIQITFDTGFHRELTLSASNWVTQGMHRSAQPETVRDYQLIGTTFDGKENILKTVTGNYQRVRRHKINKPVGKIKLQIDSTNGSDNAIVFEIRAY